MKLSDALLNLQARIREFNEINLADNQTNWENVQPILKDARRFAVAINEAVNPGTKEVLYSSEDNVATIVDTKDGHGFISAAQEILNRSGIFASISENILKSLAKLDPNALEKFRKTRSILNTFSNWMFTIANNYSQSFTAIITGQKSRGTHAGIPMFSDMPSEKPSLVEVN